MHSDDLKNELKELTDRLDKIEESSGDNIELKLKCIEARAILLNADITNELNWTLFFMREKIDTIGKNIRNLQ